MRNNARLILDLFRVMGDSAMKKSEIKSMYEKKLSNSGRPGEIRSTEISSFCAYQYAIGTMKEGIEIKKIRGRKPLKPELYERDELGKETESFIEKNEEELYNLKKDPDDSGKITYVTLSEKIDEIFNSIGNVQDYRNINEKEIKLALKWKPKHIIVKGKIFKILLQQSRIDMTRSFTHSKQNSKFDCFLINESDFDRFEKNQGKFCDVACEKITGEENELENTILLKIESETQS